ncbi:Uncharacterized protein TCM_003832 [Theobroma cacao]|uniref:Uncharacterized protein n=1 Tax=Theobroma cacao TaxID=3641 RepID=A0A061DN97_THECC|nr:Uncharacterized protein TCM_003832 [Theobroma cacao]
MEWSFRMLLRGSGSTRDYDAHLFESLVSFSMLTLLHGGELRFLYIYPYFNKSFQCLLNNHELVYVVIHVDFFTCHTFWERSCFYTVIHILMANDVFND